HQALYELSGNPVIEDTIGPQWPHMRRAMACVLSTPRYPLTVWDEHALITRRVLAGDPDKAERAARSHALGAGRTIDERLKAMNERAGPPVNQEGGTHMKLTPKQIEPFHTDGWLFLPEVFDAEEVGLLKAAAEAIYRQQRSEVWREKSGAPRTAFAAHTY